MLVSIIILVHNRPRLTRQTLDSLLASLQSTIIDHEVICVDNNSSEETQHLLRQFQFHHHVRLDCNTGVGKGKNVGVDYSHGDYLYISDNDIYFKPGWLEAIVQTSQVYPEAKIIGAFRHPFHGLIKQHVRENILFEQSDQQVGSSWFLSRSTWDAYGPLLEGVSYGVDDVAFNEKVKSAGGYVGSISPYMVIHCGAKNSHGDWTPGGKDMLHQTYPEGLIVE